MILRPPPSTPGVLQGGGEQLCSPKDVWQCLVRFLVVATCLGAAAGISWVEARDLANRPIMHWTVPCPHPHPHKEFSCPNVRSAEVEKSQSR